MAAEDGHLDAGQSGQRGSSDGTEGLSSRIRALLLGATVEERRKSTEDKDAGSERRRRSDQKSPPATPEN
jgi:hypothetical protein